MIYEPLFDVSVIIPAFQEEQSIGRVVKEVQKVLYGLEVSFEIIVVDDGSNDLTERKAREAGALVICHPYNIGNGAAVKTGIRHACGKFLVMMDGDGQHKPEDIPLLLEKLGRYDMVVGARSSHSETRLHRDLANAIYNNFASFICGFPIRDLTSGFRAIKADIARSFVSLLPNTFSYPTTMTMAVLRSGFSLLYVPIKTTFRVGKSKIRLIRDGSRFLLIIVKIATLFSPMRVFVPVSLFLMLTGAFYGAYRIYFLDGRYGQTAGLVMVMAIIVFMVGLVSEQVAQLRSDQNGFVLKSEHNALATKQGVHSDEKKHYNRH